jgi:hypothetical protein
MSRARAIVWTWTTAAASLALGLVGGLLILPLGLIVDERLSWLLVLAVAAAFAALGGTWVGSLVGREDRSVDLAPVLGASELAAIAVWLVRLSPIGLLLARAVETNLAYLVTCVVVLALVAVLAAAQSRGGRRDRRHLRRATLGLLGVVIAAVPAVVYVASLFGLVGA